MIGISSGSGTGSGGGGGGGGGGGLNSLDQPWHPEIAHGVFELLTVHVTFELLGMFLDSGSPVVFDLVICSSRQVLSDFGPPVSPARMELKDEELFFESDISTSNIWTEIV